MEIPTPTSHRWLALVPALGALALAACFQGPQGSAGSARNVTNKYGYGGTVTDPSGTVRRPSTGPDALLANAISPQPGAGPAGQPASPPGSTGKPPPPLENPKPPKAPDPGVTRTPPPAPPSTPPPATASTTPKTPAPETPPSSPPSTPPATKKTDYPYGIPVPGREGLVYSPHDKSAGYVDVRDMKPGSLVECPYTKKYFRVP